MGQPDDVKDRRREASIPATFWIGWVLAVLLSLAGGYGTATYTVARVMERVAVHDVEISRLRDRQNEIATKTDLRELRIDLLDRLNRIEKATGGK